MRRPPRLRPIAWAVCRTFYVRRKCAGDPSRWSSRSSRTCCLHRAPTDPIPAGTRRTGSTSECGAGECSGSRQSAAANPARESQRDSGTELHRQTNVVLPRWEQKFRRWAMPPRSYRQAHTHLQWSSTQGQSSQNGIRRLRRGSFKTPLPSSRLQKAIGQAWKPIEPSQSKSQDSRRCRCFIDGGMHELRRTHSQTLLITPIDKRASLTLRHTADVP